MSRRYDPSSDYDNWWNLGSRVSFLHNGERLEGVIVRVSSNPCYFHVEAHGVRYEVDMHDDDMHMVWDKD